MSNAGLVNMQNRFHAGIEEMGHRWGWYLALGAILIILGIGLASDAFLATVASVMVFGWVLVVAGITLGFLSVLTGKWSGFLISMAAAILAVITGIELMRAPLAGAATLTLLIASYFGFTGIFRAVAAIAMQFPNWGWSVVSGMVSIALGAMLLSNWPSSSLWFIGFYVGIDLIVHGFAWCMFAMSVRRLSRTFESVRQERPAA